MGNKTFQLHTCYIAERIWAHLFAKFLSLSLCMCRYLFIDFKWLLFACELQKIPFILHILDSMQTIWVFSLWKSGWIVRHHYTNTHTHMMFNYNHSKCIISNNRKYTNRNWTEQKEYTQTHRHIFNFTMLIGHDLSSSLGLAAFPFAQLKTMGAPWTQYIITQYMCAVNSQPTYWSIYTYFVWWPNKCYLFR